MKKEIVLMLHQMSGGGAERVMILLANWLAEKKNPVTLILTSQRLCDTKGYDLHPSVQLLSLKEMSAQPLYISDARRKSYELSGKLGYKSAKLLKHKPADSAVFKRYMAKCADELNALDAFMSERQNALMVAFLDHPIHLSLLMKEKFPDIRLVISERNDPKLHDSSLSSTLLIKRYYHLADGIVFQSGGAKEYYSGEIQSKSVVIPNPITQNLPTPFTGVRKKKIVNFCRISHQKNLPLLMDAFAAFHQTHPDYTLDIIGDADNEEGQDVLKKINEMTTSYQLTDCVTIKPFDPKLHDKIIDYAMFVSSSDYEGMSNSMLEAMAIGLPTICTDCPAGGAREIIQDYENGLLVPIQDADALCKAMSEVADDPCLAEKLSANGAKLRERLSVDQIMNEWWKVINA